MPPLGAFHFIEYAVNGITRRNNVCPVEDFAPPVGAADVFTTWFRYTEDLAAYLSTHRNQKGKPSVEGYAGPAYAPRFVADFDHAADLELARRDAVTFITRLCQRFDVSPNAFDVAFSGSKGFSVEIPGMLFGEFEPMPAPQLAERLKALAAILGEGLQTLDPEMYQRVRLWRRHNTINSKSGRFKIPLTVTELKTLDIPAIQALATGPRTIERPPDEDWDPIPDLASVWHEAAATGRRRLRAHPVDQSATRIFSDSQAEEVIDLISFHWNLGQKHDLSVCVAGFLKNEGFSEKQVLAIIESLAAHDERPSDRINAVRTTFARLSKDEPVRGYSGLRRIIPELELATLDRLVAEAETKVTVGGRQFRKPPADKEDPASGTGENINPPPPDDDESPHDEDPAGDERAQEDEPAGEGDEGLLDALRRRATQDPGTFAREALSEPATLSRLARAAREDRGAYEAFLIWLQEEGIKAGDIKRIERAVNDALRRGRPKFRTVGPDEAMDPPRVKDALPDAPVTDAAVVPFGYRLTASGVIEEHLTEEGERRALTISPTPIVINGRLIDVTDNQESFRVAWLRDERWRELTVGRVTAANARDIVGLANVGFPVTSRTAGDIVAYAAAYEAANLGQLPRARVSRQLGWQGPGGSLGFLFGRSLIRADGEEAGEINLDTVPPDEWDAEWVAYHGSGDGADQLADAFTQAGSFEEWVKAAERASRFPRVALAMYAALATPLLDVLGAPNFVIDWSFATSTGKTTTLRLGGSCWGNPNEQAASSVVGTWDATRVWVERASETLNCLPLILDDTARAKQQKVVAQTIYDVSQGRGRGRGSPRGMRRSGTWATILLSTGEAPATTFTDDGGTRARTLTLWGPPFGGADQETAAVVSDINLGVRHHYGHAGPRIVRYLLRHRQMWDVARERYHAIERTYLERAAGNPVAGRFAQYFALLDASAGLAHRALELPWEYEHTVEALWEDLVHEASEADRARAALAMVMSWAQANAHTFDGRLDVDRDMKEKIPTMGLSGKWERSPNWETIAFYPHRITELLEKAGHNPEAIQRTWRDRDWLDTSGDRKRLQKTVRIQGELTRAVVIRRFAVDDPDQEVD